jgi:3-methyl-2-oxobutanoate hydroxymethyltransferase
VPRFAKDFLTSETGGVPAALRAYVEAVRNKTFPAAEHTFA